MEKNDLEELKKIALEEHQFYTRRYEQVSLIISGFGLYACLEYSKLLVTSKQILSAYIFVAVILFTCSIICSLCSLLLEKKIRGHYLNIIFGNKEYKKESSHKSLNLEEINKYLNFISVISIVLGIISLIMAVYTFIY